MEEHPDENTDWHLAFMAFNAHQAKNAHPPYESSNEKIPGTNMTEGDVARWVRSMNYNRENLSEVKINAMENCRFPWVHSHFDRWNENVSELRQFKARHGNCRVPQSNTAIGVWV